MSLAEKLASNNITAEDLEMAAAVHLFEKQAAAEDIDLSKLSQDEVQALFEHFIASLDPEDDTTLTDGGKNKEASTDVFAEFVKQAAAEQVDLSSMSLEDQLQLFNAWLESISDDAPSEEEVKEAEAKLAEAEVIGRHMANAFLSQVEEGQKTAAAPQIEDRFGKAHRGQRFRNAASGAAKSVANKVKGAPAAFKGLSRGGKAGVVGGALAATAGGAYAVKKMHDRKKQASSPLLDQVALMRAREVLVANGIDPDTGKEASDSESFEAAVNARAEELLAEAGYTFKD